MAIAGAVALVVVLGFTMTDYHQYQGGIVGYYLIAILGLNILTGYTGQISLGNGAFMAVGGYTTAILCGHHGWGELWTIPVAAVVAGAAGFLFGIPALRLAGPYLALATFAIAVAVPSLAKRFDHFTGGSSGIILPIHTGHYLYWASWICAGIGYVVAWLVLRGRVGPGVPRGPRQRGGGRLLRASTSPPTRRSRSGSRRRTRASPARCSRSAPGTRTRTRSPSRSRCTS